MEMDKYGEHLTPAKILELLQCRNETRQILKDQRNEIFTELWLYYHRQFTAAQYERDTTGEQKLKQESFGPDAQKVRIEYRGSTITLDITDEKAIERILKIIKDA